VELIRSVGATAEWRQRNTLAIHARSIRAADLDPVLCARIRASILLAGPLLARCGEVMPPPPGGDVIGRRRLDTHFFWRSSSSVPRSRHPTGWNSAAPASRAPTFSSTSPA
jgi:UDP-N-acetylglucosamine enolpyruvyl transferase